MFSGPGRLPPLSAGEPTARIAEGARDLLSGDLVLAPTPTGSPKFVSRFLSAIRGWGSGRVTVLAPGRAPVSAPIVCRDRQGVRREAQPVHPHGVYRRSCPWFQRRQIIARRQKLSSSQLPPRGSGRFRRCIDGVPGQSISPDWLRHTETGSSVSWASREGESRRYGWNCGIFRNAPAARRRSAVESRRGSRGGPVHRVAGDRLRDAPAVRDGTDLRVALRGFLGGSSANSASVSCHCSMRSRRHTGAGAPSVRSSPIPWMSSVSSSSWPAGKPSRWVMRRSRWGPVM